MIIGVTPAFFYLFNLSQRKEECFYSDNVEGVVRAIASAHSRRLRSDKGVCLRMIDRAPVAGKCMKTRKKTVMSSGLIRVEQEMFPRYILN